MLPYGEEVHIKKTILQKNRKAVRGFTLPTRQRFRRKLRRTVRDTSKRKRRPRRAKRASRRAAVRTTKH